MDNASAQARKAAWLAAFAVCSCYFLVGCGSRTVSEQDVAQKVHSNIEARDEPDTLEVLETPWFEDVAAEVGFTFVHTSGDPTDYFMPKNMGSGAALFDADNDDRLDLFCVQHGEPPFDATCCFYRQQDDGSFVDETERSGLDLQGRGTGVAAGDVNNDGLTDLLVTFFDGAQLMLNEGDGRFRNVTEGSGIVNPVWGTSAAFCDFDRDGWLDLVIANYLAYSGSRICFDSVGQRDFCSPHSFAGTASRIFRNTTGDRLPESDSSTRPVFEDITLSSGIASLIAPALGVLCADFDGDRWPDILIANDGQPNRLWINLRDGSFEDQATLRGLAFSNMGQAYADMGIACGDVDHNGLLDVYITHLTSEFHSLWMQQSPGFFVDSTAGFGLTRPAWRSTGFGVGFADFNLDGWLDIAQVNGRVRRGSAKLNTTPAESAEADQTLTVDEFWEPYVERDQLFAGQPEGSFIDISLSTPALSGQPNMGRGLAYGDIDNDGDVDLLLTPIDAPAQLLRNIAPRAGHWLTVKAVLPECGGRHAIGAMVRVVSGSQQRVGLVQPAASYQSSCDPRVHFGLGELDCVDHLEVVWPDGMLERFPGGEVDQLITLAYGTGQVIERSSASNVGAAP